MLLNMGMEMQVQQYKRVTGWSVPSWLRLRK
jgi:hypothetical protein